MVGGGDKRSEDEGRGEQLKSRNAEKQRWEDAEEPRTFPRGENGHIRLKKHKREFHCFGSRIGVSFMP
jgi:hypothetical protein